MTTRTNFSTPQLRYIAARAAFNAAYNAHLDYDKILDAECERLGIETPYGILPDGHPLWIEAQRLLDAENVAKAEMYRAAGEMFDWAINETFKRCGTKKQKAEILDMVAKVKAMAYVEQPFEELVDMSLRLAA